MFPGDTFRMIAMIEIEIIQQVTGIEMRLRL